MFDLEDTGFAVNLKRTLELVLVFGAENARLILTTIIGGIISLTVFSFSMVMVVLNRTSASLSPRVLPQLVAQKFHQVVLGFYMGTIVFSLILVNNVDSDEYVPSLGILLSMILAIFSLGLFIYFIHSISQSIQVDNILKVIYKKTKRQIESLKLENHEYNEISKTGDLKWFDGIIAKETGYYKLVNLQSLCSLLEKNKIHLKTCIYSGEFVSQGIVLAKVDKQNLSEQEEAVIQKSFYLTTNTVTEQQYYFGLRKISEIAVKSLSPGINDPGTAVRAIHYLIMLFTETSHLYPYVLLKDSNNEIRVYQKLPDLKTLFFECISPIRNFASSSVETHAALYIFFEVLLKKEINRNNLVIKNNLNALIETSDKNITNLHDRQYLNTHIDEIRKIGINGIRSFSLLND